MPDLESAGAVGHFDRRATEFNMEVGAVEDSISDGNRFIRTNII